MLGPFCFWDVGCDRLSQAGAGSVARAALRYGATGAAPERGDRRRQEPADQRGGRG
ncbi:hypothetical protein F01_50044 [Burkholderia cenocepacia]|nr:hypothetical protein F01_50044 [Burkholderia cenocepacia]